MEMPSTTSKLAEDRLKLYKDTLASATLLSSEVPITDQLFGKDFGFSPSLVRMDLEEDSEDNEVYYFY